MLVRYCPWSHLRAMPHVTFGITRLPRGSGWWLPHLQAIVLDDRLDRVERRSVLAHEVVHAEHQHENCHHDGPDGPRLARRQERVADNLAAERLITIDDLIAALRAYPLDECLVADHLDVTTGVLHDRLRQLDDDDKAYIEHELDGVHDDA